MLRKLATAFLVSTLGDVWDGAIEAAPTDDPTSGLARRRPRRKNPVFRALGRFGGRFLSLRAKARIQDYLINRYRIPVRLVPPEELRDVQRLALERLTSRVEASELGDYLEFGVYQGTSLMCMHQTLDEMGLERVRLFGFDSFAGLPQTAEEESAWSAGQFRSDLEFTRQRLDNAGVDWNRTLLIQGYFSETLNEETRREYGIERASVIMVDCDLYSSTKEVLDWCYPLLSQETVFLFDDWDSTASDEGEQRAFAELLQAHPELGAEELGSYSARSRVFLVTTSGAGSSRKKSRKGPPKRRAKRARARMAAAMDKPKRSQI